MIRYLRRFCSVNATHTYRVTLQDANELASLRQALSPESKLLLSPFATEAGATASQGSRLDSPFSEEEEEKFPLELEFLSPVGVRTETLHSLKNTVADKQKELLYAMASFQNLQRTQKAEIDTKSSRSVQAFAESLLPFMDHLDVEAAQSKARLEDHAFVEGIKLTQENATKSLGKFSIASFRPKKGDVFVRNKHEEAESVTARFASDANTVKEVRRIGWTYQNTVLRKADVVVYRNEIPTKKPVNAEAMAVDSHNAEEGESKEEDKTETKEEDKRETKEEK